MKNLLILFNPYYQNDVIEQHLSILREHERVAFGKVMSKFRDMQNSSDESLAKIYAHTSEENFIQLF
ncbi:MAG: ATPase [Campylobacter sp.]|nr:ATPase [Campylobacter sp.]